MPTVFQQCKMDERLSVIATTKINDGQILLSKLNELHNSDKAIAGVFKLKKKIESEINILQKKLKKKELKSDHVDCSNISHLAAVVDTLHSVARVNSVLKTFVKENGQKLTVDIVGEGGLKWYKVICRDPKALHHIFVTGGKNGVQSMKSIGQDFIATAKLYPHFFSQPKVYFIFVKGASSSLANALQRIGVDVQGQIINDVDLCVPDYNAYSSSEEECENIAQVEECTKEELVEKPNKFLLPSYQNVNLDVTCLIAYVSATSNGGCNFSFEDQFLTEQARLERINPVKVVLDNYFQGHNIMVCKPAAEHFKTILDTIGGCIEKERGNALLSRCTVINTNVDILEDNLKLGGRIKKLSRLIFSTGMYYQAPTITANRGYVRAAQNQGVNIPVLFHEPRALTEQKQPWATAIRISN